VNSVSMDSAAAALISLRKKGVRIWSEKGQLHYRAPRGALTQEEIGELRALKRQIVALLEKSTEMTPVELGLETHPKLNRAPLTFSQLMHWHWKRLSERPTARQVASAMRLRGRLNIETLQRCVAVAVRRHDALRTRVVVLNGVPVQEISGPVEQVLKISDLSSLSVNNRESEVQRLIEEQILQPIHVSVGPLFEARLLRLHEEEHVLVITMEHIISDGVSHGILLSEIFAAYKQMAKGGALSLPPIPFQFANYAVWQRDFLKSWLERHGAYWGERVAGYKRLRFPDDQGATFVTCPYWGVVQFQISRQLKAELREWSRLRKTTVVMSIFTVYVALVLRWCNASNAVIGYQSDGRVSAEMQHTIGYFSVTLYLQIELHRDDSFVDLMRRVAEEYLNMREHPTFSYLAAQMPLPEWTRSTVFNWVPQESTTALFGMGDELVCSPVDLVRSLVARVEGDGEPCIVLFDTEDGETACEVWFPTDRFSKSTMERFGQHFLFFTRMLLDQPEGRVSDIQMQIQPSCSDGGFDSNHKLPVAVS